MVCPGLGPNSKGFYRRERVAPFAVFGLLAFACMVLSAYFFAAHDYGKINVLLSFIIGFFYHFDLGKLERIVPYVAVRYLINEKGEPFANGELDSLVKALDAHSAADRMAYRNDNARAIARHPAELLLIVAGPGTGKSSIFKQRVLYWLERKPEAQILALSFVRKLVADLRTDIQTDGALSDAQKSQVDVFTLHKYARSVVEQNRGTREWSFAAHFRIIGQIWKEVVWHDGLLLSGQKKVGQYPWKAFEKQLHDDQFDDTIT